MNPQQPTTTTTTTTKTKPLPVYAEDGTDLTVIRWMLSKSPEERLRWMQAHMQAVARLRHG